MSVLLCAVLQSRLVFTVSLRGGHGDAKEERELMGTYSGREGAFRTEPEKTSCHPL